MKRRVSVLFTHAAGQGGGARGMGAIGWQR